MSDFFATAFAFVLWIGSTAAWFTSLIQSAQQDAWALFVTSLVFPPWGVLVGVGYWLNII